MSKRASRRGVKPLQLQTRHVMRDAYLRRCSVAAPECRPRPSFRGLSTGGFVLRPKGPWMDEEEAALQRIRILRRDGYACKWRTEPYAPVCGAPAPCVGTRPADDEIVALCRSHSLAR